MNQAVMTATTYVSSKALIDNLKTEAQQLAQFYDGDIKIEINMSKKADVVKINVIEYNL